jgi:transcriptional regulator with XRE-family HTH domain
MNFAYRIRCARTFAKLTQTELAAKLGVRRTAVAQWEQVVGTKQTMRNLTQLAIVTEVRFEWLATGRGPIRLGELHSEPAAVMSEFAHDILESRLLNAIRRLSMHKREVIVEMVEGLGR